MVSSLAISNIRDADTNGPPLIAALVSYRGSAIACAMPAVLR